MADFVEQTGTQIVLADHAGDFSPAAGSDLQQGTPTTVQMSLASISDGAARQSAKFDYGATRAKRWRADGALEFAASGLTAGERVELYNAPSPDATAANGNPGGVSGSDAAYAGYSSNLAASKKQLDFIGSFIVTGQATGTVQIGTFGEFSPGQRYGSIVFIDESGAAMHSDDVEMHIVLTPLEDTSP